MVNRHLKQITDAVTVLFLVGLFLVAESSGWAGSGADAPEKSGSWVESVFPEAAARVRSSYGLTPFIAGPEMPTAVPPGNGAAVVLVHGLDEPGRVWLNLSPALHHSGYRVWFFSYPNDQAIDRSARFFLKTLKDFHHRGPVIIVAHSMGGLVSRQMLTDPDIGYTEAATQGQVPAVTRLIMVGTPNQGADLARFRILMEIREQAINLFSGNGHPFQGFFDGSGEAAADLLPGSPFLTRLNHFPHPPGVAMTVIAGILHPWLPEGDGLVMADSARLSNIPFFKVSGSHLTMIRNLTASSDRVPPAVPLILYILSGNR